MLSRNHTITWKEYTDESELDPADRELVMSARKASESAYAPYSGFSVGAALRLDNGVTVTGTNVENAAFPSGICAERNAISTAVSGYPSSACIAIAIAARTADGLTADPVPPCGNCRQVIAEEESRTGTPVRVILSGKKSIIVIDRGGDLLPIQFNRKNLRSDLP